MGKFTQYVSLGVCNEILPVLKKGIYPKISALIPRDVILHDTEGTTPREAVHCGLKVYKKSYLPSTVSVEWGNAHYTLC